MVEKKKIIVKLQNRFRKFAPFQTMACVNKSTLRHRYRQKKKTSAEVSSRRESTSRSKRSPDDFTDVTAKEGAIFSEIGFLSDFTDVLDF